MAHPQESKCSHMETEDNLVLTRNDKNKGKAEPWYFKSNDVTFEFGLNGFNHPTILFLVSHMK